MNKLKANSRKCNFLYLVLFLLSWDGFAQKNVLLVVADDLGQQLGCYGDKVAKTPNLDNFSQENVRFENAFVTQASCSPSRSSILTGLYPHQNGQIGLANKGWFEMRKNVPIIPNLLKKSGYYTGVIGKVHVNPEERFQFDYKRLIRRIDTKAVLQGRATPTRNVMLTQDKDSLSLALNQFFQSNSNEAPFFLMVNLFDPHEPFLEQVKGLPEKPYTPMDVVPWGFQNWMNELALKESIAGYYNGVSRVDAYFKLILDTLKKQGLYEDTLIIFIGDHGPPFSRGKTTAYEAGLRIPFLMKYPNGSNNIVRDELISTIDILPTILDYTKVKTKVKTPGHSLLNLIEGKKIEWRTTYCAEFTNHSPVLYYPRRTIRDSRFKLILNLLSGKRPNPMRTYAPSVPDAYEFSRNPAYEGSKTKRIFDTYRNPPKVELYDLINDPYEFINLAENKEYQKKENNY